MIFIVIAIILFIISAIVVNAQYNNSERSLVRNMASTVESSYPGLIDMNQLIESIALCETVFNKSRPNEIKSRSIDYIKKALKEKKVCVTGEIRSKYVNGSFNVPYYPFVLSMGTYIATPYDSLPRRLGMHVGVIGLKPVNGKHIVAICNLIDYDNTTSEKSLDRKFISFRLNELIDPSREFEYGHLSSSLVSHPPPRDPDDRVTMPDRFRPKHRWHHK